MVVARPDDLIAPRSGRLVRLEAGEADADQLTILDPRGEIELTIRLTPEGPVLTVSGANLELVATRTLSVRCEQLDLQVDQDARLGIGGSSQHVVEGDHESRVGGRARLEAHAARIEARRGNVELEANDDVRIDGERIWLNR